MKGRGSSLRAQPAVACGSISGAGMPVSQRQSGTTCFNFEREVIVKISLSSATDLEQEGGEQPTPTVGSRYMGGTCSSVIDLPCAWFLHDI